MADAFLDLKTLNSLNLSSNNLHMISPKSFNGLEGLSEFDLSNNQFDKLQRETFTALTGLAFMSLNGNKIKMVSMFVRNLHKFYLSKIMQIFAPVFFQNWNYKKS